MVVPDRFLPALPRDDRGFIMRNTSNYLSKKQSSEACSLLLHSLLHAHSEEDDEVEAGSRLHCTPKQNLQRRRVPLSL